MNITEDYLFLAEKKTGEKTHRSFLYSDCADSDCTVNVCGIERLVGIDNRVAHTLLACAEEILDCRTLCDCFCGNLCAECFVFLVDEASTAFKCLGKSRIGKVDGILDYAFSR